MKILGPALAIAMLFFVGCANTKNIKVTKTNQDTVLVMVAKAEDLTDDEKQLTIAYFMRGQMGGMLGSTEVNPVGKTVAELIAEQRIYMQKTASVDKERGRSPLKPRSQQPSMPGIKNKRASPATL